MFKIALILVALSIFTFVGAPSAPQPYTTGTFMSAMDVQVHDTTMATGNNSIPTMLAQHGAMCEGPPATHQTTGTRGESVFLCNNHFMTALNGDYGAIYITPPEKVDFTTQGTVSFDVSTEDVSARDWWDITISPFIDAQALPLRSDLSDGVDLQAANKNSIVITTDNSEGAPNLNVIRNGVITRYPRTSPRPGDGVVAGTNEAVTRQTFKVTLTSTRVKFERNASATAPALVFFDETIAPLNWTQGVVQLGHHSYNPTKDCVGYCIQTYHWNNIVVEPAVPFYISKANPSFISNSTDITGAPAPANAYLRFSAICRPSVNGVLATKHTDTDHPEHTSSYMVPVPQGSTSWTIGFANDSWYDVGFGCHAKDFHIWADSGTVTPPPPPPPPPPAPITCRVQVRNSAGNWTYNTSLGSYTGTMLNSECRR